MQIQVRLHGILRERLPAEAGGRVTLTLDDGANLSDLLARLGLGDRYLQVACNEAVIEEFSQPLYDGDRVELFLPTAGG